MEGLDKLIKAFKNKPTISANRFLNIKELRRN